MSNVVSTGSVCSASVIASCTVQRPCVFVFCCQPWPAFFYSDNTARLFSNDAVFFPSTAVPVVGELMRLGKSLYVSFDLAPGLSHSRSSSCGISLKISRLILYQVVQSTQAVIRCSSHLRP